MARRAHGQRGSVDGNVPTKNGGETSKSGNETRTNTKSTEPSKILSLNAQGLIKTDMKWKVEMIKEYVHENRVRSLRAEITSCHAAMFRFAGSKRAL